MLSTKLQKFYNFYSPRQSRFLTPTITFSPTQQILVQANDPIIAAPSTLQKAFNKRQLRDKEENIFMSNIPDK